MDTNMDAAAPIQLNPKLPSYTMPSVLPQIVTQTTGASMMISDPDAERDLMLLECDLPDDDIDEVYDICNYVVLALRNLNLVLLANAMCMTVNLSP